MPLYYIGRTCRVSVKYSRTRNFVHLNNLDSSFGHKDRKLHTFPDSVTRTPPVMPSPLCPFVVRISQRGLIVSSKGRTIRKRIGGGGGGWGRSTKKLFAPGKLNEKKFMHAN